MHGFADPSFRYSYTRIHCTAGCLQRNGLLSPAVFPVLPFCTSGNSQISPSRYPKRICQSAAPVTLLSYRDLLYRRNHTHLQSFAIVCVKNLCAGPLLSHAFWQPGSAAFHGFWNLSAFLRAFVVLSLISVPLFCNIPDIPVLCLHCPCTVPAWKNPNQEIDAWAVFVLGFRTRTERLHNSPRPDFD